MAVEAVSGHPRPPAGGRALAPWRVGRSAEVVMLTDAPQQAPAQTSRRTGESPRPSRRSSRRSGRRRRGSGGITQVREGVWRVDVEISRDPLTGKRRRISRRVSGTREDAEVALAKLRVADHERRVHRPGTRAGGQAPFDRTGALGRTHALVLFGRAKLQRDVADMCNPMLPCWVSLVARGVVRGLGRGAGRRGAGGGSPLPTSPGTVLG